MMFFNKNISILLLFSLSIFYAKDIKSNIDYNNNCKKAYEFVLSFHFNKSDSILEIEKHKHPDNSVVEAIKCSASFLKYFNYNTKTYLDEYYRNYKIAIDKIEAENSDNPYKLYLLSDLYLHSAFINALQSNYITAIVRFKKAYNSIYKNKEKYPDFLLNKKSLGLINITIGSIPKNYNWTLSILKLKGNTKLGNQQLENLLTSCIQKKEYNYLFVESLVLFSYTHYSFGNKVDTNNLLFTIFNDQHYSNYYSNNQIFTFSKASYFKHLKHNNMAIKALEDIQSEFTNNPYKLFYLDYIFGECLLYKNDIRSIFYFDRYLSNYTGKNYLKSAIYKKSWMYLLNGNINAYKAEMSKINSIGVSFFDSDKQAQKAAEKNIIPNVEILKSRLLFDGGYYQKANFVLQNAFKNGHIKSKHDQLEYIYRLARIYDALGDDEIAEIYYKLTIEKGRDMPYYFAANSALNLGYYYEHNGQLSKAMKMYSLCLELDYDEYQNSITQKAKNGINRIEFLDD